MKALFDTNILIDYLNGITQARDEINRAETALISPISWMEVMVGTDKNDVPIVRAFLGRFAIVALSTHVAELAVSIRREHRIRLPDAIIWASAKAENAVLVSRNTRDFPPGTTDVRVPYTL